MDKKNILIVEDDEFLGELAQKKFELEGFEVIMAKDGDEVFALLEKKQPNVVLLDIMLPGIDGYEILRQMKISDQYKSIPVIMYSNLGQRDQIERATSLGAAGFLIKAQHTLDEVVAKVKQVMK